VGGRPSFIRCCSSTRGSNCELTSNERKLLWELFNDSCTVVKKSLDDTINFYQNNRILYGKFKHGLTIIPRYKLTSQSINDIPSTILCALNHRLQEPPSICVKVIDHLPLEFQWFNTISILPYWEMTFKKYGAIMSDLRKFVTHLVNNHLLWAENCGEDYFPLEKQPDGDWAPAVYITQFFTEDQRKKVEPIISKIVANTYIINRIYRERCTRRFRRSSEPRGGMGVFGRGAGRSGTLCAPPIFPRLT